MNNKANKIKKDFDLIYSNSKALANRTTFINGKANVSLEESQTIRMPSRIDQTVNVRISKRLEYSILDLQRNSLFAIDTIDQVYSLKRPKGNDLLVLLAIMIRAKELNSRTAIFKSYREIARLTGLHIDIIKPALENLSGRLWFGIDSDNSGIRWIPCTLINKGKYKYTYRLNENDYTQMDESTSGTIIAMKRINEYRSIMPNREIRDKAVLFFMHYVRLVTRKSRPIKKLCAIKIRDTFFYEQFKMDETLKEAKRIVDGGGKVLIFAESVNDGSNTSLSN
jgi:hypothetical protein